MDAFSPSTPSHLSSDKTLNGVAAGIGAGALWGLAFLAPKLLEHFTPLQLTVGRYGGYGLIAAALIVPRWRSLASQITRRQWLSLAWLSLAGNTLYYILLSYAVQSGGIAMTSLVIGFLPVAVTVIGSRDSGAVPLRRLMPSLMFCAAGIVCIGWQSLAAAGEPGASNHLIGVLCAFGALASWTAYAVGNARCLKQLKHISAHDWSLLTGIVTGVQSAVLIPLAIGLARATHGTGEWLRFGAVVAGVAVLASIVGNALWNRMSRLLPLTLVGQMILAETCFALIYGLLWEQRWPTWAELAALGFVMLSVFSCLAAHSTSTATAMPRRTPEHRPRNA